MNILSLPPELVRNIADNLGTKDLLDLQQACRDMRRIVAPLIWSHIHLDVSPDLDRMYSLGVDACRLPRYKGECETVCRPRTFFNEHKCRKRTIKVDHRCIADFCSAFLSDHDVGAYTSAFDSTRTLTLNLYDYPSAWVNLELDPTTTREEIGRQDPATLFTWVLETLVPQRFTKINRIDITTSTRHIRPTRLSRLINILWEAFPVAEKNVDLKLLGSAPLLPKILCDSSRIVELKLYNESKTQNGSDSVTSLLNNHKLPTSVERFSISCDMVTNFQLLRSFLSHCDKLKELMIRALVLDECSFEWIPDTVLSLSLVDIYCESNTQTHPTVLNGVESLEVINSCADVFDTLCLPNLKRLKFEGNEVPSESLGAFLSECPKLEQLDASNLAFDQLADILNSASSSISSLIINPSVEIRDFGVDCLNKFAVAARDHEVKFSLLKAKGWDDDVTNILKHLLSGLPHCSDMYIDFDCSPRSDYAYFESSYLPDVEGYFRRPSEFSKLLVKLDFDAFGNYQETSA